MSDFVFKINGQDFSDYLYFEGNGQQHETLVSSARDATGYTSFDIIRGGRTAVTKLYRHFKPLTREELRILQQACFNYIVQVTYVDDRDNTEKTITCYCGDNKQEWFRLYNGELMAKDFTFNFIEC